MPAAAATEPPAAVAAELSEPAQRADPAADHSP